MKTPLEPTIRVSSLARMLASEGYTVTRSGDKTETPKQVARRFDRPPAWLSRKLRLYPGFPTSFPCERSATGRVLSLTVTPALAYYLGLEGK